MVLIYNTVKKKSDNVRISVVIPAFNEEKFIADVIKVVKSSKVVDEIIVVDNNSSDNTSKIASSCGATVAFCKKQGKGYAMEKGLKLATGDIIIFIDGDICNYKKNFISKLINPIVRNEADFVKATFKRDGGRVTELLAKPLLALIFPELKIFDQPLSGIIAGRVDLFKSITFEKDYGVDVGILIDIYKTKAKMQQVNIGEIKNQSQDWHSLIGMANEVARAILKRQ